jgi:acyl-coenzyme A synthetase/AMP-(fatty) acid ligase
LREEIVVIRRIYTHARDTPDRTAVLYDKEHVSYRQFANLIDTSRRHLADQGLPGDGIAVLAVASVLDSWILALALRSLGLTTIVLRVRDDIDRLGLRDIRCVVATDERSEFAVDRVSAGHRLIRVPQSIYAGTMSGAAPGMPDMPVSPGGHIQLTSGTTGIYKKILIDPAGEAMLVRHRQEVYEISDRSVVNASNFGAWTSIGYQFPAATWDAGGTVVLCEAPNERHGLQYDGITHVYMIPRMLAALLAAPAGAFKRDDGMRLFVGGGPLPPASAQAAKARLTSHLHTFFAASEAGVIAVTPIEQAEDLRWHRILASRDVQIVDANDRPVPAGQVGLMRVNTIGNVTGYLDDETASRSFFHDGYFYSGDLGVIRADGRLALHGRVTDVVNVLGDKVAAGPIEDTLQQQWGVAGVCVVSMPDATGEEIIHVAIEAPHPVPQSDLATGLAATLPSACRVQVRHIDLLPRNSMGKIQRDALKQWLRLRASAQ